MPESHTSPVHDKMHDPEPHPHAPHTKRVARWYHGGIGSAMAACCTHPLDLLKVMFLCANIGFSVMCSIFVMKFVGSKHEVHVNMKCEIVF